MKNAFKSAFKVLANLAAIENMAAATLCGETDPSSAYACTRDVEHEGKHVAIGDDDELLAVWGNESHLNDRNANIMSMLDILITMVHDSSVNDCPGKSSEGYLCLRKKNHTGLHVAVGGPRFGAAWE